MTLQGNLDTLPVLPPTVHPDVSLLAAPAPPPLFRQTPDGKYVPYILPQPGPLFSAVLKPPPIPLNRERPLPPLPREDTLEPREIKWDGWPNGYFAQNYDQDMLDETGDLHVHWACKNTCGDRKGSVFATSWEAGRRSTRQCLGILKCDNEDCQVIVRPQTDPRGIAKQLRLPCKCRAKLSHLRCPVRSVLRTWTGGIYYSNGGFHNHDRLTHILSLLPHEEDRFRAIVTAHPNVGPLGLIVGLPGLNGPGESVADISDVLLNPDRVRKEKQKLKKGDTHGGDTFIAEFSNFSEARPGFVIYSQLGAVTVIVLQTPFMVSQLVKDDILTGALNGLVSDAAHGWWRERTSLLVITSTYCPQISAWVPGIFLYTNGASAEHYKYHFLALFQSMAREAETRQLEVVDRMFAGVCIVVWIIINFTELVFF
jgi:hypothetical protein